MYYFMIVLLTLSTYIYLRYAVLCYHIHMPQASFWIDLSLCPVQFAAA